ncbi:MAG TPA: type I asparaginase [Candidatus Fournierella merdigallinarum]|nr:type I asparaginase [Candidatus Fournierella merdigallinarum]
MKKRICILYTGGTIGMVLTPRGYAPRRGYLGPVLRALPQLSSPDAPAWELVEMDPLLDSSNVAVAQWRDIGRAIFQRYDQYDGFVVLHGTDTMAYTAAALSFSLENLQKPVVLTGSQIPLCRLRSDGPENLITSLLIAADGRASEVCLYFGGKLLRGNRAVKRSADGFRAFSSPNYPPLALTGVTIRYDEAALCRPAPDGPPALAALEQVPIGVLKVFPGIQFELFEPIMTQRLRGIVLETFGAGNIPDEAGSLPPLIRKAWQSGTVLTVCSQCFEGGVKLGEYAASAALTAAGAVSGGDMTTEAAVAKLYYLFSKGYDAPRVKALMAQNLRGERTDA